MPDANGRGPGGEVPRCIAIVGPQGVGKTTMFHALLGAAGSAPKRGAVRGMGSATQPGHCDWLGDPWCMLDTPGSVEFAHEACTALSVADLAVVVCDPGPERAVVLAPLLHQLETRGIPAILFINRIDQAAGPVRETLAALQAQSRRKLVLRQVPLREGDAITGYVDVVSERAYRYRRGAASEPMPLPPAMRAREQEARGELLEALADHDDTLLEKLLEDVAPAAADIYRPLHAGEAAGAVVSVLIGSAEHGHGIRRLWKALRHDTPALAETRARLGIAAEGEALAQVFRTQHAGHAGRLSFARIWRGALRDGGMLGSARVGGITRFPFGEPTKAAEAMAGEVAALGRLEGAATGATLGAAEALDFPTPPAPVFSLAVTLEDRKDEVRLSAALARLVEDDPALRLEHDAQGQTVLHGQGEVHLRHAIEAVAATSGVKLKAVTPQVAYRETIRHKVQQHSRLKRQTGGHGQFADVKLEVAPRPRGAGFEFRETVVGGAVPRRFIPAVGEAAAEACGKGPLGHPVVDVAVTLLDGGFHSVDSSDMAFANATRLAMQEALAKAEPVLLEPLDAVRVTVPSDFTPAAQRLLTGRRGQILGYAGLEERPGWDAVEALVPEAELHDFIIELRSQTMGLGSFTSRFDHLAEARR